MNKCKIVRKNGLSQFILKSQKGQQISEREVYAINSNEVNGLLKLEVIGKKTSFKLVYDITGFITFRELLRKPLDKESFARILQNILQVLKSLQEAFFNQQHILLDFDHVMVNPATQRLFFLYVPIQDFDGEGSLRSFLLEISQAEFIAGEDNSFVKEYITILNSGINFSIFALEEYINNIVSGQRVSAVGNIECPKCHVSLANGTHYCSSCGAKVSGTTGEMDKIVYDPLKSKEMKFERTPVAVAAERKSDIQGLNNGTTVLGADFGGTTVLGSGELDEPVYPYLIRKKNEEKISVNKPSFRIGKEKKYSDYFVSDNSAVSRSHADIITRDRRYYIVDLNSTNKTYVDGRAIQVEKEVEIFSGTELRLANEDFSFHIEN